MINKNTKFVVHTLGCKVNQSESMAMINQLKQAGFFATDEFGDADCYIINTCAVTAEAARKSRQAVGKVARHNPNAKIFICGCASQDSPKDFELLGVRLITGSTKTNFIEQILTELTSDEDNLPYSNILEFPHEVDDLGLPYSTRTRAYLKVQDGCNCFCSYCAIPLLRGRSRSSTIESVVQRAQQVDSSELVIIGIDLPDYGNGLGYGLSDLLFELRDIKPRIRLGSLSSKVIDNKFLDAIEAGNFCEHFHLSLQSACDSVLKSMNRRDTVAEFESKVNMIRQRFPLAAITTDIIAGFSGESEQDHLTTCANLERIGLADAHVFPYSVRANTRAAKLAPLSKSVRSKRAAQISQIVKQSRNQFIKANLNTTAEVLFEEGNNGVYSGYTRNYIRVNYKSNEPLVGKLLNIVLTPEVVGLTD